MARPPAAQASDIEATSRGRPSASARSGERSRAPALGARDAFIAAFVAFQLLLPLRYYASDDLFDERFAWRMFSPIRVTDCTVEWTELRGGTERTVDLASELPQPWIGLMRRARLDVLEAYARRRCTLLGAEVDTPVLRLDIACDHPDGDVRRPLDPTENLCERVW